MRVIADLRTPLPLGVRRRLRALRATMSDDDQPDIPPSPVDADDAPGGPLRAAAAGRPAAGAQAPPAARGPPARAARDRLDGLRDDDGGRARPAEPRDRARVPERAQLRARRPPRQAARHPRRATATGSSSRTATSRRSCATRSSRSRTSASTRTPASTCAASAARFVAGRRQGRLAPGRLDDHPAVRQERARGAGQPHGLPEAARGGARLPPDAQVVEGQDPHRVPELDLLRQRRLRHRVGRARLLRRRPEPRRLRRRTRRPVREGADRPRRRRCSPASSPTRPRSTRSRTREAATRRRNIVLREDARAGQDHARRVRRRHRSRRCPRNDRAAARSTRRRRTSRPGSASSSSSSSARAARSRAGCGSARRSTSTCRRPRRRAIDTLAAEPRRPGRRAGRDRQRDRRGPGAGRRHELPRPPVQPRHPGPAPAGLDLQAVHPRRGAEARLRPRLGVAVAEARLHRAEHRRQGEVRRQQLRQLVLGLARPRVGAHGLRQLGLRRRRASRPAPSGSPS